MTTAPRPTRQVVVTGMGAVTPSGLDVPSTWEAVRSGVSGITRLDATEFAGSPVQIGGRVRDFDPAGVLPRAVARRLSPVQQWAVAAADEALRQAGVTPPGPDVDLGAGAPRLPWPAHRFAIVAATGSGPVDVTQRATRTFDSRGARAVPWSLAVHGDPDAAAALLSLRYRAQGPSQAVSATCASGAVGLGTGLRWVRHGYADAVLVVGMDDCLNPVNLSSNANLRALATGYEDDPAAASRPFDAGRRGFVMSSGAAAMLLEADRSRHDPPGAPGGEAPPGPPHVLALLAGFGASSDAHHPTSPPADGHGAAQAVREALDDAGLSGDEIEVVNAHGTGTPLGDAAELAALQSVFGDRGHHIPVSATKSSTGHLLGASGVLEAILTVQTLRTGTVPPTINLDDPQYPEWDIVTGSARERQVRTGLSTSFGFGGHNGAIVLRAPDGKDTT